MDKPVLSLILLKAMSETAANHRRAADPSAAEEHEAARRAREAAERARAQAEGWTRSITAS
jgi:hypothetical protein